MSVIWEWKAMGSATFHLGTRDLRLVRAFERVCRRFLAHPQLKPEDSVGLSFALLGLSRLPNPTSDLTLDVSVATRLLGSDQFRMSRYWSLAFDDHVPEFSIDVGGWAQGPNFADSFTQFELHVELGRSPYYHDGTGVLQQLDQLGPWPAGMALPDELMEELNNLDPANENLELTIDLQKYPSTLEVAEESGIDDDEADADEWSDDEPEDASDDVG